MRCPQLTLLVLPPITGAHTNSGNSASVGNDVNLSCNKMNKISDFLPQNQKSYIDFNAWNWIQTITALILDAVK